MEKKPSQSNLFDVSTVASAAKTKIAVHKKKNVVAITFNSSELGLNSIWKNFGEYIKKQRGNSTL